MTELPDDTRPEQSMAMRTGLHALNRVALRRLRAAVGADIAAGRAPSEERLSSSGLGEFASPALSALLALPQEAWLPVLDALLAERDYAAAHKPTLVWTGPERADSEARDTAVVLRELLGSAQEHVLLAGYAFDHGRELLRPLMARMRDAGVSADVYLDIKQRGGRGAPALSRAGVEEQIAAFFEDNWPWGSPRPRVWFDKRVLEGGEWTSLHAKCVVIDRATAYITSANFTERGTERNVEVGVVLRDRELGARLAKHFVSASSAGLFVAG